MQKRDRRRPNGRRPGLHRSAAVVLAGLPTLLLPAEPVHAQAQEDREGFVAECARHYESGQEARAAGRLAAAREHLALCADPACPGFVQGDCANWLQEVEAELPRVLVDAKFPPGAPEAATFSVDGKPVPLALSGEPIQLDPGVHEIVVERPGQPALTRRILVQQGERRRLLEFDFAQPPPAGLEPRVHYGARPWAYGALGAGVLGMGAFAALELISIADNDAFAQDCRNPNLGPGITDENPVDGSCAPNDVRRRTDSINDKRLAGNIALGVGITGIAAGILLLIMDANDDGRAPEEEESNSARLDVQLGPGSAAATLSGRF